MNKIVV